MSSRMSSACWSRVQHASRISTGSGLAGRTQREVSDSSYSFKLVNVFEHLPGLCFTRGGKEERSPTT